MHYKPGFSGGPENVKILEFNGNLINKSYNKNSKKNSRIFMPFLTCARITLNLVY